MKSDEIKVTACSHRNGKKIVKSPLKTSLPLELKACLFILCMGALGTLMGGVRTIAASKECHLQDRCFTFNTAQERLNAVERDAFAGMGAAFFLSLPALLKQSSNSSKQ